LKSASRADLRVVVGLTLALVPAAAIGAPAQTRRGVAPSQPAWMVCAGSGAGSERFVHQVRRLTALSDHAAVEQDIARVFAQREKEQRVSAVNLAKARLSIDFLYAAGDGTARMYYYESSKTIADAEGLLRVSVSGWLRGDGGQPRSLGSKSELQWLERADDPDADKEIIPNPAPIPDPTAALLPQGVLWNATGQVWVMRRAIGSGPLLVYEVSPGRVWLRPRSSAKACS
jgi:hypothetical protein